MEVQRRRSRGAGMSPFGKLLSMLPTLPLCRVHSSSHPFPSTAHPPPSAYSHDALAPQNPGKESRMPLKILADQQARCPDAAADAYIPLCFDR